MNSRLDLKAERSKVESMVETLDLVSKLVTEWDHSTMPSMAASLQHVTTQAKSCLSDIHHLKGVTAGHHTVLTEVDHAMKLRFETHEKLLSSAVRSTLDTMNHCIKAISPSPVTPTHVTAPVQYVAESIPSDYDQRMEQMSTQLKAALDTNTELIARVTKLEKRPVISQNVPQQTSETIKANKDSIDSIKVREGYYEKDLLMLWAHVKQMRDHLYPGWRDELEYLSKGGKELQEVYPFSLVEEWNVPVRLPSILTFDKKPSILRPKKAKPTTSFDEPGAMPVTLQHESSDRVPPPTLVTQPTIRQPQSPIQRVTIAPMFQPIVTTPQAADEVAQKASIDQLAAGANIDAVEESMSCDEGDITVPSPDLGAHAAFAHVMPTPSSVRTFSVTPSPQDPVLPFPPPIRINPTLSTEATGISARRTSLRTPKGIYTSLNETALAGGRAPRSRTPSPAVTPRTGQSTPGSNQNLLFATASVFGDYDAPLPDIMQLLEDYDSSLGGEDANQIPDTPSEDVLQSVFLSAQISETPGAVIAAPIQVNEWPQVDQQLQPRITPQAIAKYGQGSYHPTNKEVKTHQQFYSRRVKVISLAQKDSATSLRLFSPDDSSVVIPTTVLADTGADLTVCISRALATKLKLTWEVGSASLVGVGGVGGALGTADQRINVRLGGVTGRPGATDISPLQGCFTMSVQPIILTDDLVVSIKHQVILGQTFLHHCLASFDPLMQTMEISPAFMSHKCADFRVSIPVSMGQDSKLAAWFESSAVYEPVESYLGGSLPMAMVATSSQTVVQAVSEALSGMPSRHHSIPVAMPLHPGKPQSSSIPTHAEFQLHKDKMSQRAQEQGHEPAQEFSSVPPLGVCYPLAALKSMGVLQPDMSLSVNTQGSMDSIREQVTKQIRTELLDELHQLLPSRSGIPKPVHDPAVTSVTASTTAPLVLTTKVEAQQEEEDSWLSLKLGVPLNQLRGKPKTCTLMWRGNTASSLPETTATH
jgi:hypothetical protein